MCGRFAQTKILKVVRLNQTMVEMPSMFQGRYNIAPSQDVPVIRADALNTAVPLKWGFESPRGGLVINARIETIHVRPMFRDLDRCMILADGFYEWKNRQPYYFQLPDRSLFAFAGLCHKNQCVVVTRAASEDVKHVHDRMPVILTGKVENIHWLRTAQPPEKPSRLNCHPVSKLVNKVENDTPACIEPVSGQSEFLL